MSFSIDKQTLDDLNIFGKPGGSPVYQLFNKTATQGGAALLETFFRYPLNNAEAINDRSGTIRWFGEMKIGFPYEPELFDAVTFYLSNRDERSKLSRADNTLGNKVSSLIAADKDYLVLSKGVSALIGILQQSAAFVRQFSAAARSTAYLKELTEIQTLLNDPYLVGALTEPTKKKLSFEQIADYDRLFRFRKHQELGRLLEYIYRLDVYISVAAVAAERGFCFPKALAKEAGTIALVDVFHPHVKGAVANTLTIDKDSNIVFLTGANMAGKSTLMKSLGIAVLLAHMGFPVAAQSMTFSVRDGMFTSINLADNLNAGASHFYAEVLRVKKVVKELSLGKQLFIIFDELFRGTNVKDAYEATIAITAALAQRRNCMFMVSTHIMEAGEVLSQFPNIAFKYLPTRMNGNKPVYTYQLESGITEDRQGMIIIRNERILDVLEKVAETERSSELHFTADQQTLKDLNLLGKYSPNSIFSLFNKVKTRGGEKLLELLFRTPMTDERKINERSALFRHFQKRDIHFPFTGEQLDAVENYISESTDGTFFSAMLDAGRKKLLQLTVKDERYAQLQDGLWQTWQLISAGRRLLQDLTNADRDDPYRAQYNELRGILLDKHLGWLDTAKHGRTLSLLQVARFNHLVRGRLQDNMKRLLELLYELDVLTAVSSVAKASDFSYADALPKEEHVLQLHDVRHPGLRKAQANSVTLDKGSNVLFLTGANMAGKSTLMKTVGVATYLAHMGFPVTASSMRFSVKDGMYTSINVADDISRGHSHFYAEVLRVKTVAEAVGSGKNLLVIFDELFKGTNVKDAYDATFEVSKAFAAFENCSYIISTHIIEVGAALRSACSNILFSYMPTIMQGHIPSYTYQLTQGITTDRHGMMIIENEGILDILEPSQELSQENEGTA